MSEIGDDFRALREIQKEDREKRTVEREAALDRLPANFRVHWFTAFHVEIDGHLQLWPSSGKYWDRRKNKRGHFTDPVDTWVARYLEAKP